MDESDEWGRRAGELTLQDYLAIFLRRRWLILAIIIASLGGVTAWNLLVTPTYESTASVLLRTNRNEQLFPSVPQAQRNEFVRQQNAEFEYASSTAFTRQADAVTPEGVTVEPEIDDENATSLLDFVARADDPERAQAGAAAWADTYLSLRRQTAIDRIAISILDTESQMAELEVQKAEILEPLAPIEQALQSETDSDAISRLTTQRLSLTQALEDELLPVNIQLRELSQNLARLRIAEGLVARENVSEVLSTEAPLGRRVGPQVARNTALAGVLGLLVAAGAALVAESLTSTIRNDEDLRRLAPDVPVLAQVPELPRDATASQLSYQNGSPYAEALERLVSALLFQRVGRPGDRLKLLITSALPGEGKTTVAANLIRRLSLTEVRTVAIDADLRRPMLHNELGMKRPRVGLSDLLASGGDISRAFSRVSRAPNVRVLTAGNPTNHAAALLRQSFRPAIEQLPLDYDILIVDAPPVLAVTDAEVLIDAVDTVVLVVRANNTKRTQIVQAIRQLAELGASIGGFVLLGVRDDEAAGYRYSYGYHTDGSGGDARATAGAARSAAPAERAEAPRRGSTPGSDVAAGGSVMPASRNARRRNAAASGDQPPARSQRTS